MTKSRHPENGGLILVERLETPAILDLAITGKYNHLVQKSQPETVREIRTAKLMAQTPDLFFEFPIASTLRPRRPDAALEASLTLMEWKCSSLADKEPILNDIEQLFDSSRLNSSLCDDVVLTANEFICNALFNAPCRDGVNDKDLSATLLDAQLELEHPVLLRIGAYKGSLAISCRDNFGTLNPTRILNKLKSCQDNGIGESINFEDRGTAGIGCFMVFTASTSFYMAVKSSIATQFCALFPLKSGTKERNAKNKNLHWFKI